MKSSKPWTNQLWALSHNITVFDLNNKKVNENLKKTIKLAYELLIP